MERLKYYHLFKKLKGYDWDIHNEKDRAIFEEVVLKYNTEEWQNVMKHLVNSNMSYKRKFLITKNSFKLSQKIHRDLNISVFPVIERVFLGSMHNSEGYATWRMYESNMNVVGSNQSIKDFLLKKNIIVSTHDSVSSHFLYAQRQQ